MLRLVEVTPTKLSFTREPAYVAITPFEKLRVPVRKAKQVASIYDGVIFAKRTIVGNCV